MINDVTYIGNLDLPYLNDEICATFPYERPQICHHDQEKHSDPNEHLTEEINKIFVEVEKEKELFESLPDQETSQQRNDFDMKALMMILGAFVLIIILIICLGVFLFNK